MFSCFSFDWFDLIQWCFLEGTYLFCLSDILGGTIVCFLVGCMSFVIRFWPALLLIIVLWHCLVHWHTCLFCCFDHWFDGCNCYCTHCTGVRQSLIVYCSLLIGLFFWWLAHYSTWGHVDVFSSRSFGIWVVDAFCVDGFGFHVSVTMICWALVCCFMFLDDLVTFCLMSLGSIYVSVVSLLCHWWYIFFVIPVGVAILYSKPGPWMVQW